MEQILDTGGGGGGSVWSKPGERTILMKRWWNQIRYGISDSINSLGKYLAKIYKMGVTFY